MRRWLLAALLICALLGVAPAFADEPAPIPPDLPAPDGDTPAAAPPPAPAIADLANGRFFAAGADSSGYAIVDEPGGPPFWSSFARLGGMDALGAPVSRPFLLPDGRVYQATQYALLVWLPGSAGADLADVLDLMSAAGLDDWLLARGIPRPLPDAAPAAGPAATRAAGSIITRFGWLTDPAIREAYLGSSGDLGGDALPAALARYGLPASRPEPFEAQVTQRFQRGALRRFPAGAAGDADGAPPGTVVPVPVGELLRESGLLSEAALAPDALVGGRLVARAPRPQLARRSDAGWGIAATSAAPPGPAAAPGGSGGLASPPTAVVPSPVPGMPSATPIPAATPRAQPAGAAATPPAAALPQPGASVAIRTVFNQGRTEYVVVANDGTVAQELTGWALRSVAGSQVYAFPAGFILAPGAAVRVHSGSGDPAVLQRPPTDLFATPSNIWNNTGDTAQLVDPTGRVVSQYAYGSR